MSSSPHAPIVAFDVSETLRDGRLAIEASAGTGKTYALTSLAVRYIAERGIPANELLIVTFTRAATAELRNRVRERIVIAADHLAQLIEDDGASPGAGTDELLTHLGSRDLAERLAHLERAISEFDAANISTIHGFATQVLATLGSATAADPDASFVDDQDILVEESCCDVLAAAAARGTPAPLPKISVLRDAVRVALRTPDLLLAPTSADVAPDDPHLALATLVRHVIDTITERRRIAGTVSYDNILVDLRAALRSAPCAAIESIRNRYSVALIDEFQDTDPVQWEILSTLFPPDAPNTALVLVGDPKQAIYSFRGADVTTFTQAVRSDATVERALATNWRSDGALLDALGHLLGGTVFGDGIRFTPVEPANENRQSRLLASNGEPVPPVSLRLALDAQLPRSSRAPYDIPTMNAEQAVYGDLGREVRALLDTAHIPLKGEPDADTALATDQLTRPVRPADIAVLVRTGREADAVQALLLSQGVPAVLARSGNVLSSPAATQWRWLLEALNQPSDPGRTRTFALSWFGGWNVTQLNGASDAEVARLQDQLHVWAECLGDKGVSELIRRIWTDSGVAANVLTRADGDRSLTDLDHIGELLQLGASGLPIGNASVAGLLAALEPGPNVDELDETIASRRVETESEAVQIMTVWVSKGLEFPIVLCPTLWRQPKARLVISHDHERGERILDLAGGKGWPDAESAAERKGLSDQAARSEDLRLLYVALTRARHRVVLWWTRTRGSETTALAHLLFGDTSAETIRPAKVTLPPDESAAEVLRHFEERSDGAISVAMHGLAANSSGRWVDPRPGGTITDLDIARLDRVLDRSSARWSFTAITRRADSPHVDPTDDSLADRGAGDESSPENGLRSENGVRSEHVADTAPLGAPNSDPGPSAPAPPVSPLSTLPAGAAFGTMVHSVLEEVDFADDNLTAALTAQIERQLLLRRLDLSPQTLSMDEPGTRSEATDATDALGRALLADGLRLAIETPLGSLFDHRPLSTFPRQDRIDEMSFELTLGEAGEPATDRSIGGLIVQHLDADHPLTPWATAVAEGAFNAGLAGHLTGSIDAVIRVRDADRPPRFVVVDYKTNRLTPKERPAAHGDYGPTLMTHAMAHHHYPLQALLYTVALHRFLRSRLPDYSPDVHLGGAAYLFVRGMGGPPEPGPFADFPADSLFGSLATSQPASRSDDSSVHGVFGWAIPPQLVVDLSALLHGSEKP